MKYFRKFFGFTLALGLLSSTVGLAKGVGQRCSQNEAQIIGVVKSTAKVISHGKFIVCYFTADFKDFNQSHICPIDEAYLSEALIEDPSCFLGREDEVSGVLIQKETQFSME